MPRDFAHESELPAVVQEDDPVLRCLIEARRWLDDPAHWCRVFFEKDTGATCIYGAIIKHGDVLAREWLLDELPTGCERSVMLFNDDLSTTHDDVLALFDRAIGRRKASL